MPAYQNLVAWVITTMLTLQPAYDPKSCWWGVHWTDTYETTAEQFVQAAINNPLQSKKDGPDVIFTIALMMEWASKESRFKPDAVGDGGHSYGIFQVNPYTAGKPPEVLLTPSLAAPVALDLFHFSFKACKDRPVSERMAQYAWGRDCEHRLELSRSRMATARELARTFDRWTVEKMPALPMVDSPVTKRVTERTLPR